MAELHRKRSDAQILVVEDEGLIARHIRQTLEQLGYTVVGVAATSQEALELLSLVTADLALMDIKIRGEVDGVTTAGIIQQRFDLPVVYLTSHADPATLERAQQTGPFGYVIKPFTAADLQVSIEIALNRYRLQAELREKEAWLRTVLQSISDAIIVTDCDGAVKFISEAGERLTGWNCAQAQGKPFSDVIDLEAGNAGDGPEVLLSLNRSETYAMRGRFKDRSGVQHAITGTISPIHVKNRHEIYGSVLIFRDAPAL